MRRKKNEAGWLRRAQQRREADVRRFAERGPVSQLPAPEGNAERISADELEESS